MNTINLPLEIIQLVGDQCQSFSDYARLAQCCKAYRQRLLYFTRQKLYIELASLYVDLSGDGNSLNSSNLSNGIIIPKDWTPSLLFQWEFAQRILSALNKSFDKVIYFEGTSLQWSNLEKKHETFSYTADSYADRGIEALFHCLCIAFTHCPVLSKFLAKRVSRESSYILIEAAGIY